MATQHKNIAKHSGLKIKDYIGYALGDFGICLVWVLGTSLLQTYYTNILAFDPLFIMIMFIAARVWDAINDPIMGRICDGMKKNRLGKYKRWFLYGGLPLAICSIVMFIPGTPYQFDAGMWPGYLISTVTYIFYGMSLTMIQIPYGSLASVVTLDDKERSKLSIFRSVGAMLGQLPVVLVSSLAFPKNEAGKVAPNYTALMIGIALLATGTLIALTLAYFLNKERVEPKPIMVRQKGSTVKSIKRIVSNRAMLSISVISLLNLAGSMFTSSYYSYIVFHYYTGAPSIFNMMPTIFGAISTFTMMWFVPKLGKKFGKKEISAAGCLLSTIANISMIALVNLDPNVSFIPFFVLTFISQFGAVIFSLQVWGMATDAIDDMQVKTGAREDGTSYAVYMFFRKFGQILAAVCCNCALIALGYLEFSREGREFSPEALKTMFLLATIIPAVINGAVTVALQFWYPISKKRQIELQDEKEEFYAKENAKAK